MGAARGLLEFIADLRDDNCDISHFIQSACVRSLGLKKVSSVRQFRKQPPSWSEPTIGDALTSSILGAVTCEGNAVTTILDLDLAHTILRTVTRRIPNGCSGDDRQVPPVE
jgi:hypothetical protein